MNANTYILYFLLIYLSFLCVITCMHSFHFSMPICFCVLICSPVQLSSHSPVARMAQWCSAVSMKAWWRWLPSVLCAMTHHWTTMRSEMQTWLAQTIIYYHIWFWSIYKWDLTVNICYYEYRTKLLKQEGNPWRALTSSFYVCVCSRQRVCTRRLGRQQRLPSVVWWRKWMCLTLTWKDWAELKELQRAAL